MNRLTVCAPYCNTSSNRQCFSKQIKYIMNGLLKTVKMCGKNLEIRNYASLKNNLLKISFGMHK